MGYRIREARAAVNMSQEELAQKSGVSRATISGLESGRTDNVTAKTLLKLANALGTTVDSLFFANDD